MAEVIFFASIREDLDHDRLTIELPVETTVSQLINLLAEQNGDAWRQALAAENVRVAVNQELITSDPVLNANDEIAFFPPVTGG